MKFNVFILIFSISLFSKPKQLVDENVFFKILESEFLNFERQGKVEISTEWVNSKTIRIEQFFYTSSNRLACLLLREKKIALYYPQGEENCIGKIGYELSLRKLYNLKRKKIIVEDSFFEAIIFEYKTKKYFLGLLNLLKPQKYDLWDNSSDNKFIRGVKIF